MHPGIVPQDISEEEVVEYLGRRRYMHIRSSFLSMPSSRNEAKKTGIPIVLSITPLPIDEEEPKRLQESVPRCGGCKAYLNPQCEVIPPGYKWRCSICKSMNNVSSPLHSYGASLRVFSPRENAENNRRVCSNPILTEDIIEFPSGSERLTPPSPVYLFAIEATNEAIERGLFSTLLEEIPVFLDSLHDPYERAELCIVLFGESVQIVRLDGEESCLDTIYEVDKVLPVLMDTFYIAQIKKVKFNNGLETLLKRVEATVLAQERAKESNFTLVLKLATTLLLRGGQICAFLSSPPSLGEGAVGQKASGFYKQSIELFLTRTISLSLFVMASRSIEVPSLLPLIEASGGELRYYPAFLGNHQPDRESLRNDLSNYFSHSNGTNAFFRIRVSDGLLIKKHWGISVQDDGLIKVPLLRRGKTFSFEVEYESDLVLLGATFQVAMIYTTAYGERIVRTINHSIEIGPTSIDPLGVVHAIALYGLDKERVEKGTGARLVSTMATTAISSVGMTGIMKVFPKMIYGLIKNKVFKSVSSDLRGMILYGLCNSPMKVVDSIIYPNLVRVDVELEESTEGYIMLPPPLSLTSRNVSSDGTYFLDSGIVAYLFTGETSPYRLFEENEGRVFVPYDEEHSRIRNVMEYMMPGRTLDPAVYSVHQTGHSFLLEGFQSMLIEDGPSGVSSSYGDFLSRVTSRGYK